VRWCSWIRTRYRSTGQRWSFSRKQNASTFGICFLFATSLGNSPKKISGIGAKGRRLDLVLSPAWRDLYSLPPPQNDDVPLLSSILKVADEERRAATQKQIEEWFRGRLNSIFAYASEPLRILTGKTRQAFSLFLAIANPSAPAINLAKHFHSHVLKNFAPEQASHRKSAR